MIQTVLGPCGNGLRSKVAEHCARGRSRTRLGTDQNTHMFYDRGAFGARIDGLTRTGYFRAQLIGTPIRRA